MGFDPVSYILGAKSGGGGGGGGGVTVEPLSVSENGSYTAPSGKAYSPVVANVPNSYKAYDEGKVVYGNRLVNQDSLTVSSNGTYDTTLKNIVTVNIAVPLQSHEAPIATPSGQILGHIGSMYVNKISPIFGALTSESQNVTLRYTFNGNQITKTVGVNGVKWETYQGYLCLKDSNQLYIVVVPEAISTSDISFPSAGTYAGVATAYSDISISWSDNKSYNGFTDYGKVVVGASLSAQSNKSIAANGTFDTTLNDSVTVNVSGSGITTEYSDEIQLGVGADLTSFGTFVSNHTIANGWTIIVVSDGGLKYPLYALSVKNGSSPSSKFTAVKQYSGTSVSVCTLTAGTYTVSNTNSPFLTSKIKLVAYQLPG